MIMHYELVESLSHRTFAEKDQPPQTGFLNSSDLALGVVIQIRQVRRQFRRLQCTGRQSLQELCHDQRNPVMNQISFADQEAFRGIREVACYLAYSEHAPLSHQSPDLHPSARQVDYEEHEKSGQTVPRASLDGEKVCRYHDLSVLVQKPLRSGLPLTLARRFPTAFLQTIGEGAPRNIEPEIGQRPLDSPTSPIPVLGVHAHHQALGQPEVAVPGERIWFDAQERALLGLFGKMPVEERTLQLSLAREIVKPRGANPV
jgi:hypothetical protein